MKRLAYGEIKALLHFDYPYFSEPGDGCGDEIGLETWTRQGNTKFVGTEIPNDIIVANTPRFGYRCAQFAHATDCIRGTNFSGIWNLSSNDNYEVEMFIRPTSAAAGNILVLRNNSAELFALSKNASNQLALLSGSLGINKTATRTISLSVWSHVVVRLSSGTAQVFLDGNEVFSQAMTGSETLAVSEVCLGGFIGQMDEFIFRHFAGSGAPTVPVLPCQGTLNLQKIGGFGNGKVGNVELSIPGNTQINSYAMVVGVPDERNIYVGSWKNGVYGSPVIGDELMLHVSLKRGAEETALGFWATRRILKMSGSQITLDSPIADELSLSDGFLSKYYVQAITVPNFDNLKIRASSVITPHKWDTASGGGIVAFRCKKDCAIQGKILSHGYMARRDDRIQMTHNKLVDRFLVGSGGGIFMCVGGKISTTDASRLGAEWAGDGKGGAGGQASQGYPGGSGYGGGGGSQYQDGGRGGVGGGGGGAEGKGGDAGKPGGGIRNGAAGTGGGAADSGNVNSVSDGATAGIRLNSAMANMTGGGGAGGNASRTNYHGSGVRDSFAGANVVLVAKDVSISKRSISTGGEGGVNILNGGGGTGFCFLAYEEAK